MRILCTPTNFVSYACENCVLYARQSPFLHINTTSFCFYLAYCLYTFSWDRAPHWRRLWHILYSDSLSNICFIRGASAWPDIKLTVVLLYTSALITCQLRERLHQGCSLYLAGDWRRYRVEVTEIAFPWTDKPVCVCHFKNFRTLFGWLNLILSVLIIVEKEVSVTDQYTMTKKSTVCGRVHLGASHKTAVIYIISADTALFQILFICCPINLYFCS